MRSEGVLLANPSTEQYAQALPCHVWRYLYRPRLRDTAKPLIPGLKPQGLTVLFDNMDRDWELWPVGDGQGDRAAVAARFCISRNGDVDQHGEAEFSQTGVDSSIEKFHWWRWCSACRDE